MDRKIKYAKSHLYCFFIALILQLILWRLTGSLWLGALAAIGFLVGREITQTEYRWIAEFGDGLRANLPIWGWLDPRAWTLKSLSDWVSPSVAVALVALFWRKTKRD